MTIERKGLLKPAVLLYGPLVLVLATAGWYHLKDAQVPEPLYPPLLFLLALSFYGYARLSVEQGRIGAGTGKVRRHRHPRAFRVLLYIQYGLSGMCVLWGLRLLLA